MAQMKLVISEHHAHHGYSDDDSWNFLNAGDLSQAFTNLNTGNFNVGRYVQGALEANLNTYFCPNFGNCDFKYNNSSWSAFKPCLVISNYNANDVAWWNTNVVNKRLYIALSGYTFIANSFMNTVPDYLIFEVSSMPSLDSNFNVVYIPSEKCFNWTAFQTLGLNRDESYCNLASISNKNYNLSSLNVSLDSACDDLRTSSGTNECAISLNVLDIDENQQTNRYTLMFQPDAQNTSGQVTNLGMIPFRSIVGASAHFTGGNVRGAGLITIRGRISGVIPDLMPGTDIYYLRSVNENVVLLQASFEPCCDYPYQYSETYSEILEDVLEGSENVNYTLQCEVTSIEWSGFENLTNYCCDDSDCSNDDYQYPPNDTINSGGEGGGGEGGGGDSGGGFDECVCEWLESIDGRLNTVNTNLSGIKSAIEALDCICTNLSSLVTAINGLDLSVTNQITVTPSTAQITTPVNAPVTVNPPVNQITVTPSTAQITNPVNVTPCTPYVTVNPTDLTGLISAINGLDLSANVTNNIDGLTCENSLGQQESLACIIRDALNYSGEGLAEIHKKAFSFVDCCNNEINLIDTLVKKDSSDCVDYTLVEEVHNLNESVKLSSDEIIIENGLYSDIRKKFYQPFIDDSQVEDG